MTRPTKLRTPEAANHSRNMPLWSSLVVGRPLTWTVWVLATVFLMALLSNRLADPPLWDAAWGTSAGAAELSRNGFDYSAILSAPPFDQGGPGTHASSLLTPLLGLLFILFGTPGGVIAGHILMIAVGGALVAATFSLAKRYLPTVPALAVAAAVSLLPLIVQQVADPYIELPLALFTVLTVIAVLDGSRLRAGLFAGLAIWFKPTGLMLLPLLAFLGAPGESRRGMKNGVTTLLAAAPFSLELAGRSVATHVGADPTLSGTLLLLRNAFWILGTTTDVLVISVVFVLGCVRQRRSHPRLVGAIVLVTASFFALHLATMTLSQAVTILPRYYIAVVPLWLVVVAVFLLETHSHMVAVGFFVVLVTFSLVNWNGAFYPVADHAQAPMAERSPGGGKEYLEMEIAGAQALAASSEFVDVLIIENAFRPRIVYPELGFVDHVPNNIHLGFIDKTELSGSFAWIEEPHLTSDTVTPADVAAESGWRVERTTVWDGRWRSDLIIARP